MAVDARRVRAKRNGDISTRPSPVPIGCVPGRVVRAERTSICRVRCERGFMSSELRRFDPSNSDESADSVNQQESDQRLAMAGGCVELYAKLQRFLCRFWSSSEDITVASADRRCRRDRTRHRCCVPLVATRQLPTRSRDPPVCSHCTGHVTSRGQWTGHTESPSVRSNFSSRAEIASTLLRFIIILLLCSLFRIADCCSSRAKPRLRSSASQATTRPPHTFQTEPCPEMYRQHYCLNGATCFRVNIGHSPLYNCECSDGFMGQRCEFKHLDGSYPRSQDPVVESAGMSGGSIIVLLVGTVLISALYVTDRWRRNHKKTGENACEEVGDPGLELREVSCPSTTAQQLTSCTSCHRHHPKHLQHDQHRHEHCDVLSTVSFQLQTACDPAHQHQTKSETADISVETVTDATCLPSVGGTGN